MSYSIIMAAMPGNARIVTSLLEQFSACHVEAEMEGFDGWEMDGLMDGAVYTFVRCS